VPQRLDGELDRLESLLERADFAALEHYRQLHGTLSLGRTGQRIHALLQAFEFAPALQLLRQWRAARRERHRIDA
jgi:hypothetical protein